MIVWERITVAIDRPDAPDAIVRGKLREWTGEPSWFEVAWLIDGTTMMGGGATRREALETVSMYVGNLVE